MSRSIKPRRNSAGLWSLALGLSVVVAMAACGTGSKKSEPAPITPLNTVAARSATLPVGDATCPYGGISVQTGVDRNGDGTLQDSEVQQTQKVCNGAPSLIKTTASAADGGATDGVNGCLYGGWKIETGLDDGAGGGIAGDGLLQAGEVTGTSYACAGAPGSTGAAGVPGATALIKTTAISADGGATDGVNGCLYGGWKIETGLDNGAGGGIAGDGILQAGEVTGTSYVCAGAPGSTGAAGVNALAKFTAEPAGTNCATGGVKIEIGLDDGTPGGTAGNGVLETGEVDQTSYVCNIGTGSSDGAAASPVTLAVNAANSAGVAAFGASHYRFTTLGATSYRITLSDTASDLKWTLYGDAGFSAVVATCDGGTSGDESCTTPLLTSGAIYYLKVEEKSNIPNLFRLRIAEPFLLLAADSATGDLVRLDPLTGESTTFLNTFVDCEGPCDIGPVSGMVYDQASGKLIAGMGGQATCYGCILSIDPATGEATTLIDRADFEGTANAVPGLAMRADGTIFAAVKRGAWSTTFFRFTSAAPTPTLLAMMDSTVNGGGNGLGFDEAGTLWLSNEFGLFRVDPATGAATFTGKLRSVGFSGSGGGGGVIDLALIADSRAFASLASNPGDGRMYGTSSWVCCDTHLATLDPANRFAYDQAALAVDADGLGFVPLRVFRPLLTPKGAVAYNLGSGRVAVTWSPVPLATGYNVYWSPSPGVTPQTGTNLGPVTGTSVVHDGLADGVTYYYVVTAIVAGLGESAPSPEATVTVGPVTDALLAADRNGDIYQLDPVTGSPTLVRDTFKSDGLGGFTSLGNLSSMVYHPQTGKLFAGSAAQSTTTPGSIFTVNLATGEATFLADNSSIDYGVADMAVRPDGTIYAFYEAGQNLTTVDPTTGVATWLGYANGIGCCGNGLTFDGAGTTLYLADDIGLHVLDQATGAVLSSTPITYTGFPTLTAPRISSMSTRLSSGVVYGILNDGSGGTGPRYLVTVNLATGDVVNLGEIGLPLDGLAWVQEATTLGDTGTITGTVVDSGTTLPLAGVTVSGTGGLVPVITDETGAFQFTGVTPGMHTLTFTLAGYTSANVTTIVAAGLPTALGNVPLSPPLPSITYNFDDGTLGGATVTGTWGVTTSTSHSASYSVTDSPGGLYTNSADSSLTLPAVDLSASTAPSLSFWQSYEMESGYDNARLEVSTDGGAIFTQIQSWTGTNLAWTQQTFDLTPYKSAQTVIRFRFTTDGSVVYDGWYLDDIVITP
ncbi:MAG: carboxypeptidase regulatory-like domain-containing protein [Candidatus Lambdaproteobacteria bacterium]|nr:carboxypeptidase regulatory-like domain-containing protein [Candidatus Lambdaproteobacteria bacterium]